MKKQIMNLFFTVIFTILTLAFLQSQADAAPGDYDPSFEFDGRVYLSETVCGKPAKVLVQADDKIIVVGTIPRYVFEGGFFILRNHACIVRLNVNGSYDTTFDGDGVAFYDLGGGTNSAFNATLQTTGKIVILASTPTINTDLIRFNSNGSLD